MNVSIVGLGYVGLPLALLAAKKYSVTGIDIDQRKMDALASGKSYIDDVQDEQLASTEAVFTSDFSRVRDSEIVIICVPTPVNETKQPDLTPVKSAVKAIAKHVKDGTLVIIESTINPGVCEEVVIPLLEEESGKVVGRDIHIAHCPERINPGDPKWNVSNINRVVGSTSQEGLDRAYSFYDSIINAEIKKMGTIKEAEAVKVVENSFRDINLAFVNELAMSFDALGINLENVIDGAATKPFAFMPHHPSIGVGGHCIPVDPYYLIEYASSYGFTHRFLALAREINEGMPAFTFSLLRKNMAELGLDDKKVTVLGLSYKANVADMRESPSVELIKLLKNADYDVAIYDPHFEDESTVGSLEEALRSNPAVILAVNHQEFLDGISAELLERSGVKLFIDGKNSFHTRKNNFTQHAVHYAGIGT